MDKRQLVLAILALVVVFAAAFGLSFAQWNKEPPAANRVELASNGKDRVQDACASSATYARLKQVAFEQAIRVRNSDPENLDTLAAHSVVRMENPVVKSRDEDLNVTVCTGRFILELPPGAERGFGGERRLTAQVEYAAQAAADGSGLVYQIQGVEPIVYKLATFDLQGQRFQPPQMPATDFAQADVPVSSEPALLEPAGTQMESNDTPPPRPERVEPRPEPRVEPRPRAVARGNERPSFSCRYARSRSERMVCGSGRLAARDREMSSMFYSALADADSGTRRRLRRTRDNFLAYRERCRSEECVADAYSGRMREIEDIMADD